MILVDTSVWVDHLRKGDLAMQWLLDSDSVLAHPMVIGELAMGQLHPREPILRVLGLLPVVVLADHDETMRFVTQHKLYGLGVGYIDAHLLASVRLTPDAALWTRDKRLANVAEKLRLGATPDA